MLNKINNTITEPYVVLRKLRLALEAFLALFPYFRFFKKTRNTECPITLTIWFRQKVAGNNAAAYWPMHPSSLVSYARNILVGKGVSPGYSPGCYLHGVNGIYIGEYTFIAPNVGIMSANHDLKDLRQQTRNTPVRIGNYCWLGMNVMILPEVVLGDFTVVGAGAVVTKSFEEGYCVIAGNPARIIRHLEKESCVRFQDETAYIGYIRADRFDKYKAKYLNV